MLNKHIGERLIGKDEQHVYVEWYYKGWLDRLSLGPYILVLEVTHLDKDEGLSGENETMAYVRIPTCYPPP